MKTKTLQLISFLLIAILLLGCNTARLAADTTPGQGQLPAPNVESILGTESSIQTNQEHFSPENCQLGFEIPWEHDKNNPVTDENQILQILRALGDLEECLFARQDGWLHNFVLQNGQRTEEEVLVHLIEGGSSVDLRYDLFYNQGQFTAKKYYDGRIPENQWCNISNEAVMQVIQVKRNCKPTEVYRLLTGNNEVNGYVGFLAHNFELFKKQPPVPGYYEPKAWFTQENGGSFFVIDIKYDMSDVQGGQDPSDKPFTDGVRRHFIDLNSGRLTRYVEETSFKDGSFRITTEDVFLVFYTELPDEIAAAVNSLE